ncbi:MAG TPA: glycosyltransferase family 4 protein [Nitrososphaerales archaeon]|nr:glycosyltransferase family 4 protein [Nitrososphaerales archaeon]
MTREYPPDTQWGGQAISTSDMARVLSSGGNDVHVFCQAVTKQSVSYDGRAIVHRVGTNQGKYSIRASLNYAVYCLVALWRLPSSKEPQTVEGFLYGIDIFLFSLLKSLRFSKAKVVLHAHGSLRSALRFSRSYKGSLATIVDELLIRLGDFTSRHAGIVIAISPEMHSELIRLSRVDPARVVTILNPRDSSRYQFEDSDIKKRIGLDSQCKIVLAAGRLERRKGFHVLCRSIPAVIRAFPNAKFVLVGQDTPLDYPFKSFKEYLQSICSRLGCSQAIVFIDSLSDHELVQLYSASSVVTSPSLYEISTSVPIEAMLCGRPVVVTKTGLSSEFSLDGLNGILVDPDDSQELSDAIIKMLSLSPEQSEQVAKLNRHIIEDKFSFSRWRERILDLHKFKS